MQPTTAEMNLARKIETAATLAGVKIEKFTNCAENLGVTAAVALAMSMIRRRLT